MKKILVVAPHPDDESLGCGGKLLKHVAAGDDVHWGIVTCIHPGDGFPEGMEERRRQEILAVEKAYGFKKTHHLGLPATRLDSIPIREVVGALSKVVAAVQPDIVYVPYPGDVHTDHRIVFEATGSCTKWFRYSSVKRVLVYETLSETDFSIDPDAAGFRPNVFIDVSAHLERKLEILKLYGPEMGTFPFPRSERAARALSDLRGAAAGCLAAEAFMLLKEIA